MRSEKPDSFFISASPSSVRQFGLAEKRLDARASLLQAVFDCFLTPLTLCSAKARTPAIVQSPNTLTRAARMQPCSVTADKNTVCSTYVDVTFLRIYTSSSSRLHCERLAYLTVHQPVQIVRCLVNIFDSPSAMQASNGTVDHALHNHGSAFPALLERQ